jgi:hypothetical protein
LNGGRATPAVEGYAAGQTPKSLTAFAELKQICESQLKAIITSGD